MKINPPCLDNKTESSGFCSRITTTDHQYLFYNRFYINYNVLVSEIFTYFCAITANNMIVILHTVVIIKITTVNEDDTHVTL